MTKEQKAKLISILADCSYGTVNNSQKAFALRLDVKTLRVRIIHYFELNYPNVEFKDFYDKPFLDIMKYTIKNLEVFYNFLDYVKYRDDIRDFITTAVYICPQVFTSAVNRFIREHYDITEQNNY